jgi:hypothetical protein
MSAHIPDRSATIVPLAPIAKGQPDANIVADDSGRAICIVAEGSCDGEGRLRPGHGSGA